MDVEESASDPALRRTTRRIARDEARHAALSWRLHEWLLSQLHRRERSRLADVRRRTLDAMDGELARAPLAIPLWVFVGHGARNP